MAGRLRLCPTEEKLGGHRLHPNVIEDGCTINAVGHAE
jgi:hypothetical protein